MQQTCHCAEPALRWYVHNLSAQLKWSALTQARFTVPSTAEAHGNLANALKAKGELPMAIQFYVKVCPGHLLRS